MLFNSLGFLLFFPVVIALYFALSHKYRWMMLLGASYYFYMCWKPEYIVLIAGSTLIDYYCGLRMSNIPDKKDRRIYLILSLFVNLGLLFFFKYFNFFSKSVHDTFEMFNIFVDTPAFDYLLPVGISFYTFQTLSYTIDVYNGKTQPEKHLGIFALFVSFWPQLVAGPIERSNHLLPQFRKKYEFEYERVRSGLMRVAWGFFKKMVIADRLSVYVNEVYNNPGMYDGTSILIASYFFAFQIYCDFSGYSDIAIGSARIMGFDLMENFRTPYFSKSVREFWQRWHISLSTWFRDYLYIPLGGNRVVKWRWYYNLLLTFFVSGIWHGANWTFAAWGFLHGAYLIFEIILGKYFKLKNSFWGNAFRIFLTFHLVIFAWIFFRANSLGDAMTIIGSFSDLGNATFAFIDKAGSVIDFKIALVAIATLLFVEAMLRKRMIEEVVPKLSISARWTVYTSITLVVLWFGVLAETEFIYFQF
jgi:alginate O-acetyltransferase complex protein AlgI